MVKRIAPSHVTKKKRKVTKAERKKRSAAMKKVWAARTAEARMRIALKASKTREKKAKEETKKVKEEQRQKELVSRKPVFTPEQEAEALDRMEKTRDALEMSWAEFKESRYAHIMVQCEIGKAMGDLDETVTALAEAEGLTRHEVYSIMHGSP